MKKYIILIALVLPFLFSCELNETVYSEIAESGFFKTSADAEASLTAAYGVMGNMYEGPGALLAPEVSSDQLYPRPVVGRESYTLYNYDPNYTTIKSLNRVFESPVQIWESCYVGIERANWVILKVPGISMDAARKAVILGEAYFLRAFYHWMLAKNFGSVPVKITPTLTEAEAYTARSPINEVYAQIFSDLNEAIQRLPSYGANIEKGRPSKEVALGIYAKAALYNENWSLALEKAQNVIASGKYSLLQDVKQLYGPANESVARSEIMWAFESESATGGRTHWLMALYGPKNSEAPAYGRTTFGSIFAYQSFFDSFDPQDERRQLLDTTYVTVAGKVVMQKNITPVINEAVLVKKYMDPNSDGYFNGANIPILRLADVYLIAAEAEARLNGPTSLANGYINAVRNRAGLENLSPGLSKEEFIDAVIQERSWELFAEGDRWYDLTRTGKFLTVIPQATNSLYPVRNPQPKHKFFPIPQDEVNANPKLDQNADWQ